MTCSKEEEAEESEEVGGGGGRRGGGGGEPRSHLKTAQMITEPEGLDDHGCSFSQRSATVRTDFLATH